MASHFRRLANNGSLSSADLLAGVHVDGTRIPVVNPQRGIFKPKQLKHLLSIRTVYPKAGARIWYDDQRKVHAQIEAGEELIDYAFQGLDPQSFDNQWLHEAMLAQGARFSAWPGEGAGPGTVGAEEVFVRLLTSFRTTPDDVRALMQVAATV